MRSRVSEFIPSPSSRTVRRTSSRSSRSAFSVSIWIVFALASQPLMTRFIKIWSACPGSRCTGATSLPRLEDQRDPRAHQALQHVPGVTHHFVPTDVAGLDHLSARKGEELTGQIGPGLPRPQHLREHGVRPVVCFHLPEGRARTADDHRQQVVEVVRDARGQPAQRLHLLGLQELVLEALPVLLALAKLPGAHFDTASQGRGPDRGRDQQQSDQPESSQQGATPVRAPGGPGLQHTEPVVVDLVVGAPLPHQGEAVVERQKQLLAARGNRKAEFGLVQGDAEGADILESVLANEVEALSIEQNGRIALAGGEAEQRLLPRLGQDPLDGKILFLDPIVVVSAAVDQHGATA